jgi:two-component system, NarL family, response regulator NreC
MTKAGDQAVTVAVVDDHVVVRAGIRMLLGAQAGFEVVAEGSDAASAVRVARDHRPTILLLDLTLPDGSGLDALPGIAEASPETRVIVLTMQEGPAFAKRALTAGACGYLLKEAAETELLIAVGVVASGRRYLDPRVGAALTKEPASAEADSQLTEREREVVRLLALGCTNTQVAERMHFSVRTIESCRAHVRQKLGIDDRAALTEFARANGLLREPNG